LNSKSSLTRGRSEVDGVDKSAGSAGVQPAGSLAAPSPLSEEEQLRFIRNVVFVLRGAGVTLTPVEEKQVQEFERLLRERSVPCSR
jgi:hypothetical protein